MLAFGRFNDYFGVRRSYFSKSYIDYCVKEIINEHKISPEEDKIILDAKRKYNFFNFANLLIFSFSARRIYRKGLFELYAKEGSLKIREGFILISVMSISAMIYIYYLANKTYYNDLKFFIKKYKNVNPEQYKQAELSSKIAEMYREKMDKLEKESSK